MLCSGVALVCSVRWRRAVGTQNLRRRRACSPAPQRPTAQILPHTWHPAGSARCEDSLSIGMTGANSGPWLSCCAILSHAKLGCDSARSASISYRANAPGRSMRAHPAGQQLFTCKARSGIVPLMATSSSCEVPPQEYSQAPSCEGSRARPPGK